MISVTASATATDVARWFIKNEFDSPRDTFDGNMKLQKLLYFSQLIHVAEFGKLLFSEEMKAYENGTVINDVRLKYKNTPTRFIDQSYDFPEFADVEVDRTLNLTSKIFGEMSAKELSELNHELSSWQLPFRASKTETPNIYDTGKNVIKPFDGIFMDDVNKVRQMLDAYKENDSILDFEVINGVTFYYDSSEVSLNDDVLAMLEDLDCPEEVYTLTFDEEQGIILT